MYEKWEIKQEAIAIALPKSHVPQISVLPLLQSAVKVAQYLLKRDFRSSSKRSTFLEVAHLNPILYKCFQNLQWPVE